MLNHPPRVRILATLTLAATAALSSIPMQAQSASDSGVAISVNGSDGQAVSQATSLKHHAKPTSTPSIRNRSELSNMHAGTAAKQVNLNSPTLYPADLSYQGGPTVKVTESHPVYLFSTSAKCTTISCWGDPATFLKDLGLSEFIHIVDQYTGSSANNRYTLGQALHTNIGPSSKTKPLTDANMAAIAHSAALQTGQNGYGHIYHIFLPPGQDICFTATDGVCYSPDNPATFAFCAYHSSADFKDIGHVLYSVEPYQNVPGCQVPPGTPNGQVSDSTADVLSHELIEAITDPDGDAWWNNTGNLDLNGAEIGDECQYFKAIGNNAFSAAPTIQIGPKKYAIQREYNNNRHACTETP
jgi:hypothetical protein